MTTSIEWVKNPDGSQGRSWNPVRGCTKVSPGCKHCYAETFAERFRGVPGHPYEQGFDLRLVPEQLDEPVHCRKPTTYFVNSMSDLFHESVPELFIGNVYGVMRDCPQHTFQVLTKRPERRCDIFARAESYKPLPNVWEGVSVESYDYVARINVLRTTPAAVRFLSLEPLLGPMPRLDLQGIDWVIVGGESGPNARPMEPDWVRDIRDLCVRAGVAFFFKQWGGWLKKKTGRELDGRTWDEMPKVVSP